MPRSKKPPTDIFNMKKGEKTPETPLQASVDSSFEFQEPDYGDKELLQRKFLLTRMMEARNRRESPQILYNGLTYSENYRSNMLSGNSYTPPRQNAEDTQVVTGTTREKVLAIVSAVLNLNFFTAFRAYDDSDIEDENLGEGMTDCVERAGRMEQWDEKKIYAYYEMAVQGDCYVEDNYVDETIAEKDVVRLDDITEDMYKKDFDTTKRVVYFSGCKRTMIPGTQVYKGSMTERDFQNQPFIFTREVKSYEYTKGLHGKLPRWKHVPRKYKTVGVDEGDALGINWRLEPIGADECEIIKYQDKWNNEYQIIINGVMMLPVGLPLPWGFDGYNIVQGRLEPISAFFSESKSIPAKTKLDQEILDEMYRLAVLKTQKSYMPPIANYSQNILSRSMFLPGKVNNSLTKGDIEVMGGNPNMYSMSPSEFQMIEMVKRFIDEKSINPILQGQDPGGDQTATQVNTVTQQAKQRLGLIIFGFIQFHMQLDTLRLYMLLDNYTKATDTQLDKLKTGVIEKYRTVTISKDLGGRGQGIKQIEFTDQHSRPEELYDLQEGITRGEDGKPLSVNPPRKPIRIIQLSPSQLRQVKYRWYPEVETRERETSLSSRIEFEDRIFAAMKLFGPQSINMDYVEQQWATKNKLDYDLFFKKQQEMLGVDGMTGTSVPMGAGGLPAMEESNMQKQTRPYAAGSGPAEAQRQGFGA